MASRHPQRRNLAQRGNSVQNLRDPALVVFERAVDDRWNTLSGVKKVNKGLFLLVKDKSKN